MSAGNQVSVVLSKLIDKVSERLKQQGSNQIEHDEQWPSPCEYQDSGNHYWKPVSQQPQQNFDNVETGLDIELNEQFKQYFCIFLVTILI